jgi:hypothetical protein
MLDKEFQNLNTYVSTLYSISNQYGLSMSEKYPSIYVVEDAAVAEKKVKPIRWLIVLMYCDWFICSSIGCDRFHRINYSMSSYPILDRGLIDIQN